MLSWIVFDAVGTLITPEPSVAVAYHRVGVQHGSRLDLETVRLRFREAFRESERADLDTHSDAGRTEPSEAAARTSEPREERRWRAIVAAVLDDVADQDACFRALWDHFARPASWRCYDDVALVAERLANRGLRLAIASNFDGRLHGVCDALPALARFGPRVVSSEVGWRKPSAGFFAALADRLRCEPGEMLFVGDDWRNDVVGATRAGLRAVYLNRGGEPPPVAERGTQSGPPDATPTIVTLRDLEALVGSPAKS